MSFTIKTPFSSVVNSLSYCSQQVSAAATTAAKYTTDILSASMPNPSPSLADKKSLLISDVITQATEYGSAILDLGIEKGVVFIEIETNEEGRLVFKATNAMLEHAVWIEDTKLNPHAIWETKVAMSINKLCGESARGRTHIDNRINVEYGFGGRRWKGNHFSELKKEFEAEGLWKKENDKVTLRLPGDHDKMTFKEPQAEQKAEIALKYLYLWGKTPIEERASKKWDFIAKTFTGLVATTGPLFAPWVGREKSIPENLQNGMSSEPEASSEMFTNLKQHLVNGATLCATNMLMHTNPRAAFLASVFILFPKSTDALSVDGQIIDELSQEVQKTDEIAGKTLKRRTSEMTTVNPLPSLTTNPGFPVTLPINLPTYFSLSSFNNNLDLTLSSSNGTLPIDGFALSMGDIPLQKSFSLGVGVLCYDVAISGTTAFCATGTSIISVNIANLKNPVILGTYTTPSIAGFIRIFGTTAIYGSPSSNTLYVIDVTNPAAMTSIGNKTFATPIITVASSGSKLYLNQASFSKHFANMTVLDVANPLNIVQQSSVSWASTNTQNRFSVDVNGDNIYINDAVASGTQMRVYNVSNPYNATLVTILSNDINSNFAFKGPYLFTISYSGLSVYDNSQISNPILKNTVYVGSNIGGGNLLIEGSYLYASCGSEGVIIFDITDELNPVIVKNFFTIDSAQQGKMCQNVLIVNDNNAGLSFYNTQARTFSGTSNTPGLYLPQITAKDDLGNSIVQTVPVLVGSVQTKPIPNQQVYVGNSTLFTLDPATCQYLGATFNYTASLVGGLPLPDFIGFNPASGSFIIAPQADTDAQGTYRVEVTGDGGYGVKASLTFDVVIPNRPPYVVQPLGNQTAYSGMPFEVTFSRSDFNDLDQDTLTLSAVLVGTKALPQWIGFDDALFTFSGTPLGKGVYPIKVTATDDFGGMASSTFTITVPASAPIVVNPPGTQTGSVGNPIGFTLNSNMVSDFDGQLITYSTNTLPPGMTFNNATRTFGGTPTTPGSFTIDVTATDTDGLSVTTSFVTTILSAPGINPPVLADPITNQLVKAGIPFSFTFSANTFVSPSNATLTYQATLTGSGAPLPSGLNFDSNSRTIAGVISDPQTMSISIRATDPFGGFSVDTFSIQVVASTPPIVLNSLEDATATTGQHFSYTIPAETFKDLSNDPYTVSVFHEGDVSLPSWLHWDPEKLQLSGTPGYGDTNNYQVKIVRVNVWATSEVGSSKTSFNINVGGDSFLSLIVKYGLSFGGGAYALYTLYKEQAYIWNFFNKKKYREGVQKTCVGDQFKYQLKLDFKDIKSIKAYHNGNVLPLPPGLEHNGNCIEGSPKIGAAGYYTIEVMDWKGYISQEFDLIIKNSPSDPDPVKSVSYFDRASSSVQSGLSTIRRKNNHNNDVEMNKF